MKIFYNILLLSLLVIGSVSCESFLEERPKKSSDVVPKTVEDMELILAGTYRSDEISHYLLFSSDDVKPNVDVYNGLKTLYTIQDVHAATWEREISPINYKDYFWQYRWSNVFKSNLVMNILSDSDASEEEKQRLNAQASFKRAYNMFALANLYALPYCEENLQESGIPLRQTTSFDESIARATIEDTYNFIDKDLKAAMKLDVDLNAPMGLNSANRVTTPAVYAFAARYYLAKNHYDTAQIYAEKALGEYGTENIKDLRDFGYSFNSPAAGTITIDGEPVSYELNFPATYYNSGAPFWNELYFNGTIDASFSYGPKGTWRFPSQDLIDTYDKEGDKANDLRWKYFFVEHMSYNYGSTYDYPAYVFSFWTTYNSPSVPEMMLIKAECMARKGQWQEALNTLLPLREKRVDPSGNVALTATNQDEAIKKVLEERRREMPFTMRWYDLRRLNNNDYAADDVVVNKTFYPYNELRVLDSESLKTYTLEVKDRRYAAPIPDGDIQASEGVVTQNEY